MEIRYTLWPFGIIEGDLVYFVVIWNNFIRFGMSYQEKSGNPGARGNGLSVLIYADMFGRNSGRVARWQI
jgi:hypothetical protein